MGFKREKTAFAGNSSTDCLKASLNFDLTQSTVWHDNFGLCSLIPAISRCDGETYSIGIAADPYWSTVAPELIHMERWLLEKLNDGAIFFIFIEVLEQILFNVLDEDEEIQSLVRSSASKTKVNKIKRSKIKEMTSSYEKLSSLFNEHVDEMLGIMNPEKENSERDTFLE